MAYFLTFQGQFTNRRSNTMRIEIYRKDVNPGAPAELSNEELISISTSYANGSESKYDVILGCEANITMRVKPGSSITAETFITELYDEWKVIIYCDNLIPFVGFIEPSEGSYLMKNLPVLITIKCTDGLGLLKNTELTDVNDDTLIGQTLTLIGYVAGALKKTNLDLNIRIFCSIYESSMEDRSLNTAADMFAQAKLEYRTFLSSPTSFEDCYRSLEIMLTGNFQLYQWNGMWVISSRSELIDVAGPVMYYTDYDSDGVVIEGVQDEKTYIEVGYDKQQHAINVDQLVTYQVPAKSVQSTYNYVPWPEIPRNNKFDRGTLLPTSTATEKYYTVSEWTFGGFIFNPTQMGQLPNLIGSTPDTAYRKSTLNAFGVEINREIIVEKTTGSSVSNWLYSEGIPVYAQDKINLSFEFKLSSDTGSLQIETMLVYIIDASNNKHWWQVRDSQGLNRWRNAGVTGSPEAFTIDYDAADDTTVYVSQNTESPPIPVDGTMYIVFTNPWTGNLPNKAFYKGFEFNYLPFIAGGYVQVKGDYWLTTQDRNVKDAIKDEIFISDSIKKILKGALLRLDGSLTTPTWYRYGYDESRHYKEILNLAKFRHYHRRMRKISGTFRGVKSHSVNFMGDFFPLGFHKHYVFVDNDVTRYLILVAPLQIDYVAGTFGAIAIECFKEGDIITEGDSHTFNYIFS